MCALPILSLMMVRFEPDGGIDTDFYSFRLAGIFHSDNAKYDSTRIVATMPAVQRMVGAGDVVSRIDVKTTIRSMPPEFSPRSRRNWRAKRRSEERRVGNEGGSTCRSGWLT